MKRIMMLLPLPIALIACVTPAAAPVQAQASPDAAAAHAWISRVTALGTSGTQLTGTVRLAPSGKADEYKVTVDMRGARLGNKIPWSISTGNCGETSSTELGNPVAYKLIEASADGSAHAKSNIKLTFNSGDVYHVNFFAGPTEPDRVVSCGTLVAET